MTVRYQTWIHSQYLSHYAWRTWKYSWQIAAHTFHCTRSCKYHIFLSSRLSIIHYNLDYGGFIYSHPADTILGLYPLPEFEHLQYLGITYNYDEDLKPLLLRTPGIHTMSLNMMDAFGCKFSKVLSKHHDGSEHILPRLSCLHLWCAAELEPTHSASLVDLITSRRPTMMDRTLSCACHPLQEVEIRVGDISAVQELEDCVIECKGRGPNVIVNYKSSSNFEDRLYIMSIDNTISSLWPGCYAVSSKGCC